MPFGSFNHRLELLPKDRVEMIKQAALDVLEQVGFAFRHPRALAVLEEHGASVDHKTEVAKIPRELVMECLSKVPKEYAVSSPEGNETRFGDGSLKAIMCLERHLVDYSTMSRRPGTTEDCIRSIALGNGLANVGLVSPFVVPSDVPLSMADVRGYKLVLTYSRKPAYAWIYTLGSSKYIIEMAKAVAGGEEELRRSKMVGYGAEPTSPLQLSHHALEILLEMAQHGLPISASGSMTLLGGTSPITLAAGLTLHTAETLAGIVLVNLIDPEAPAGFSTSVHVLDQRTLLCSFGAPENILCSLAGIQVARGLGLSCSANVVLSDSNVPDFQCGFEKAMGVALTIAAGAEGIGHQGIAGADQGASWNQLVIDDEWLGYADRLFAGMQVDEQTIALEVMQKVGIGGSFLKESHTLRNLRKETWYPRLFNRDGWGSWTRKGHHDVLQSSQRVLDRILKEHYPPAKVIDREVANQLTRIEKQAARNLPALGPTAT